MEIKISIIMPVYNAEKYLKMTIESVLNQSFLEFELIAIDDGSTDKSLDILKKYSKIDTRIVVIEQENSGVSKTRNKGINVAKGKYLSFLDADDLLDSNFLMELYEKSERYNTDIYITGYSIFYGAKPDEVAIYNNQLSDSDRNLVPIHGQDLFAYLRSIGLGVNIWNKLFKMTFIKKFNINFSETQTFDEDMFFVWKCCLVANKIYLDNNCRYYYRLSNSSSIMKYHENIYEQYREGFSNIKNFVKEHDVDLINIDNTINEVFISKVPILVFMLIRSPLRYSYKKKKLESYFTNHTLKKELPSNNNNRNLNLYMRFVYYKQLDALLIWGYFVNYKMKIARVLKRLLF